MAVFSFLAAFCLSVAERGYSAEFRFQHRLIARDLPVTERGTGDYGLTALTDLDNNGDGRPDIVSNEQEELLPEGRENPRWIAWENLGNGKFTERLLLDTRLRGHELQVGDVDRDGDTDICSKPWGPRPWNGNGGKMHVDFLENQLKSLR